MLGSQLFEPRHGAKNCHHSDKAQTQRVIRLWGFIRRMKEQIGLSIPQGFTNPRQRLETSWWSRPIVPFGKCGYRSLMVPADEPRGKGDDMIIRTPQGC